ncbi:MAG: dimethyl sulfoxide reductase anchor subunit [Proteobacteria bacterium]|nr:dimethyl sulfoxide reductase anchor subunit [Pseudomonadota bacterium]
MHPAYSIIFFTTASGLGYGLLTIASVFLLLGLIPAERWYGVTVMVLGGGLVAAGLLSSTFHLGHPERAWRAVSQWRSSWLSREGVMAILTYIPVGLVALGWVIFETGSGLWGIAALFSALGSVVTVYCTGMIYASIRAIPRWYSPWVPINYLALALATGAVWFDMVSRLFDVASVFSAGLAAVSLILAWGCKSAYWRSIDTAVPVATAESATGLGALGTVRVLEQPHTSSNYLQKEMGFKVARKHAQKLRKLTRLLVFMVPFVLVLVTLGTDGTLARIAAVLASLSVAVGVVVERWLFFAEAQHAVTLYYGNSSV